MYLDFEDHRPDVPRVPSAISVREGVFWSITFHGLLFVLVALLPASALMASRTAAPLPVPELERERPVFVYMEPLVERPAPPRPDANLSDLDRRSATIERAPVPVNPDPFARGNTPERVVGAPEERLVGPEGPVAPPAPPTPAEPEYRPAPMGEAAILPPAPPAPPAGGNLGESLRNLQQYLRDQTFDNRQGGLTPTQQDFPDIQFDSKGVDFGPWVRRFLNQVRRNWYIPQAAMILSGRVAITFVVHHDGRITDLQIVRASDVEPFNNAAFNALVLTSPTLPLPTEFPDDRLPITITFHYNEGRER